MKWQILILTMPDRHEFLAQLLSLLYPQMFALGLRRSSEIEVLIKADDHEMPVGDRRELLRQKATAEYINFIDDDDLIASNYVAEIFKRLDGVDQVGFEVKAYSGNVEMANPTYHSLRYGAWINPENGRVGDPQAYCRDISHICPMRREIAMLEKLEGGFGEDCRWANRLRGHGRVKTEHYIDQVMYYYLWRPHKRDGADAFDPFRMGILERLREGSYECT